MDNSKKSIINEAGKLFSEFGFLGVSMEDIARKLGITKAALYYHFESKKELYLRVLERSFKDLVRALGKEINPGAEAKEQLTKLIQNYLKFGLKEKNLIKSLTLKTKSMDPEIKELVEKLRVKIERYFQSPLKKISQNKVSLSFLTSFLLGTMDRLILEASLFNRNLDIKKRTHQILKMIY